MLCAERAGASTRTVEQFLSAMGATRDAIEIEGTDLVVQLGTSRQPWEIKESSKRLKGFKGSLYGQGWEQRAYVKFTSESWGLCLPPRHGRLDAS